MIERSEIQSVFCKHIEYINGQNRIKSYLSFGDPVLDIRYERIVLRDSLEYCIIEIQGKNNEYINLRVPKNGVIVEVSLIAYKFLKIDDEYKGHSENYITGMPYFTFNGIDEPSLIHYSLTNCAVKYFIYVNAIIVKFLECDIDYLYWIKTDNIYFGLEKNVLKAVLYDVPVDEMHIYARLLSDTI